MDKAKRREYQNRQKYRRIPLADEVWKELHRHAETHEMPRTGFVAMLVRSYVEKPFEITLTPRSRSWGDARKGKHMRKDEIDDALLRRRLEKALARGAGVLELGKAGFR